MAISDRMDRAKTWADIISSYAGLLIPVTIFLAGAAIAKGQGESARLDRQEDNTRADASNCVSTNLALLSLMSKADGVPTIAATPAPSPPMTKAFQYGLAGMAQLVQDQCTAAKITLPSTIRLAWGLAESGPDLGIATQAAAALGTEPTTTQAVAPPTATASAAALASATPAGTIRVFVHIASKDQRPGAQRIVDALKGKSLKGDPIVVPGIQRVDAPPSATQLRCLKTLDCANAKPIADYLSSITGRPITVLKLDKRYNADPNVRPGTYELWFDDQPITLAQDGQ